MAYLSWRRVVGRSSRVSSGGIATELALTTRHTLDTLPLMRRTLSIIACKLAVVWLVLAISSVGILEAFGDCALEGQTDTASTGVCVHGDAGRHERAPSPCSTEHHGAVQCGCSCHTTAILSGAIGTSTVDLVQRLIPSPTASVPERREPPVLHPPIAG